MKLIKLFIVVIVLGLLAACNYGCSTAPKRILSKNNAFEFHGFGTDISFTPMPTDGEPAILIIDETGSMQDMTEAMGRMEEPKGRKENKKEREARESSPDT